MSYQRKMVVRNRRTGRASVVYQALGDSGNVADCETACGTPVDTSDPSWTPTINAKYNACFAACNSNASLTGSTANLSTSPASAGPWGSAGGAIGGVISNLFGGAPQPGVVQSGMSDTTKIALAGVGILGLAFILRKKGGE